MNLLPRRVRTRQQGPGLPESEVELPKQALALPHAELDSIGLLDPGRQRFAVPQVDPHSGVAWLGPQHPIDFLDLPFVESARTAGPHALSESGKTFLLIAMDQYSTDRGASPSSLATSGQVKPCATSRTPCSR